MVFVRAPMPWFQTIVSQNIPELDTYGNALFLPMMQSSQDTRDARDPCLNSAENLVHPEPLECHKEAVARPQIQTIWQPLVMQ